MRDPICHRGPFPRRAIARHQLTLAIDRAQALSADTRSRINFFMNKFRKLGFIEYNGGLKIHTSLLNVIVHD
jgi:hypothetical protein